MVGMKINKMIILLKKISPTVVLVHGLNNKNLKELGNIPCGTVSLSRNYPLLATSVFGVRTHGQK